MDIIYYDDNIIVAIKPAGVISTDEPGGMPSLLRQALGNENADIRTVHRLDQVVSGLMVFAQNPETASELSRQIRAGEFKKTYLAVVRGVPQERRGRMEDILLRSKEQRKTFVVNKPCRARSVLGGPGYTAPSDMVNLAGIGVGSQGGGDIQNIATPDVPIKRRSFGGGGMLMQPYAGIQPPRRERRASDNPVQMGDAEKQSFKHANIYALCDVDHDYSATTRRRAGIWRT